MKMYDSPVMCQVEDFPETIGTNPNTLPLTLTVPDASAVLRVGRSAVYNLVRCGRLRSLRIGHQIRIPRDAIFEFLGVSA